MVCENSGELGRPGRISGEPFGGGADLLKEAPDFTEFHVTINLLPVAGMMLLIAVTPPENPTLPDGVVRCGTPSRTDPMAIVDRIDAHGRDLRTFSSRIRMDSYDDLADETERRFGRVWLETAMSKESLKGRRNAAVIFERTVEDSGRSRERLEHFVYRDGVLHDYDHEAKLLVRRRLVEAGEDRDPLRLGTGSIPIPVGQRKSDLLESFDIAAASDPPSNLVPDGTPHLGIRLVPKAGTRLAVEGKTKFIEYWVSPDDGGPLSVQVTEADGDRVAVRFFDPRSNPTLDAEARTRLDPPEVDPSEWRIESR